MSDSEYETETELDEEYISDLDDEKEDIEEEEEKEMIEVSDDDIEDDTDDIEDDTDIVLAPRSICVPAALKDALADKSASPPKIKVPACVADDVTLTDDAPN